MSGVEIILGGVSLGIQVAQGVGLFAAAIQNRYRKRQGTHVEDDDFIMECRVHEAAALAQWETIFRNAEAELRQLAESGLRGWDAIQDDLPRNLDALKKLREDREKEKDRLLKAIESAKSHRFVFLPGSLESAKKDCLKKLDRDLAVLNQFNKDVVLKAMLQVQSGISFHTRTMSLNLARLEPLPQQVIKMTETVESLRMGFSSFVSERSLQQGWWMRFEQEQKWNNMDAAATGAPWHNLDRLSPRNNLASRHAATLRYYSGPSNCQSQGYIEWRSLDRGEFATNESSHIAVQKQIRVLANAFHTTKEPSKDARIAHCHGYVMDESTKRIGLFWSLRYQQLHLTSTTSDPLPKPGEPQTLGDLIGNIPAPNIAAKLRICRLLASAVDHLHIWSITHKSISARNILFFPLPGQSQIDSGNDDCGPYLSGFMYSRHIDMYSEHVKPDAMERIYLPAEYLRTPRPSASSPKNSQPIFHPVYDLFGLGLVLLEVAYWKTMGEFYVQWGCADEYDFLSLHWGRVQQLVSNLSGHTSLALTNLISWCLETGRLAQHQGDYREEFNRKMREYEGEMELGIATSLVSSQPVEASQ